MTGANMHGLLAHETLLRLAAFSGVLIAMLLWETLAPRRRAIEERFRHNARNLTMVGVATGFARFAVPFIPVAAASVFAEKGWGVLNQFNLPLGVLVVISILALDFLIYLQHVIFHAIPVLWRLHRVHHTDLDFDTTTGLRFHPIEIALSLLIKIAGIALLGPPAIAVLLFEILLNASSLFNHGNVRMPNAFDRVLRLAVVTPDMHRVHHSTWHRETNRNFGFFLSVWDRLMGTYKAQPRDGHTGMVIGLESPRTIKELTLWRLLTMPFTGRIGRYALGDDKGSKVADQAV
jgi:sterol desaturase/sphingolipid hydroxylase (fatty acid hydroxylase superfamily)